MDVLVCIKRVPAAAGKITLTADSQEIDTRHLAFTMSPHEECGVEEAVRLIAANGGRSTVLTLGSEAAAEQLRDALALRIDHALLLEALPLPEGKGRPLARRDRLVQDHLAGHYRPRPAAQDGGTLSPWSPR